MKRQIIIDSDARKRLQEVFGVTRVTVWKALNYESDNELARKIRYTAKKEMGGIEINGALPGFETVHDTAENHDPDLWPPCEDHSVLGHQQNRRIGRWRSPPDRRRADTFRIYERTRRSL